MLVPDGVSYGQPEGFFFPSESILVLLFLHFPIYVLLDEHVLSEGISLMMIRRLD